MVGKYTSLIHKVEETEPQERGVVGGLDINNVNINNIHNNIDIAIDTPTTARPKDTLQRPAPVEKPQGVASGDKGEAERAGNHDTPLRPYAVNAVIRCIHGTTSDECRVCSGYVRWAIADEGRFRRMRTDPEEAWQEFRRTKAATWDTTWAGELMSRALRYLAQRDVEDADLSGLGEWHDEIAAAGVAEDRERYRRAIRGYVRAGLRAFEQAQKGAA